MEAKKVKVYKSDRENFSLLRGFDFTKRDACKSPVVFLTISVVFYEWDQPKDLQSGKRKVRGAKGTRGSTKKTESKAVEESGTLPPLFKHLQALDGAAASSIFLPPGKGSSPPTQPMKDSWMEKVDLDMHDEPPPPSAVQREKTPVKTLDTLFSARLLGNDTPEPEHEEVSLEDEEKTTCGDPEDSKILRFFKKTAKEVVRWLESAYQIRVPMLFLYEHLVHHLMDEVEILEWVLQIPP
ncbi:hypothetical protein MHYP_G00268220 [Metynnis hypsauchen]